MTTFTPELATYVTRGDLDRVSSPLLARTSARRRSSSCRPQSPTLVLAATRGDGAVGARRTSTTRRPTDTTFALRWLAVGLPGFAAFVYSMRGFFAYPGHPHAVLPQRLRERACRSSCRSRSFPFFGFGGVIAAFSIGYTVAAVVALVALQQQGGPVRRPRARARRVPPPRRRRRHGSRTGRRGHAASTTTLAALLVGAVVGGTRLPGCSRCCCAPPS